MLNYDMDKELDEWLFFLLSLSGKKFTESVFIGSSVYGSTKSWLYLLKYFLSLKIWIPFHKFQGQGFLKAVW